MKIKDRLKKMSMAQYAVAAYLVTGASVALTVVLRRVI